MKAKAFDQKFDANKTDIVEDLNLASIKEGVQDELCFLSTNHAQFSE